jgi:pantetheine-phosphate adenylyltransferase
MAHTDRIALCPGTFDPVTYGHLDVIRRSSAMFDEVIVSVVNLPWRKGKTLFSADERVIFLLHATSDLPNVRVATFSNLLVEFARQQGAIAVIKGLRAISDFEYELEMNQLNRRQAPEIESVYLMSSPKYSFISSSGVKELATFGGEIGDLVPDEVAEQLKERLGR